MNPMFKKMKGHLGDEVYNKFSKLNTTQEAFTKKENDVIEGVSVSLCVYANRIKTQIMILQSFLLNKSRIKSYQSLAHTQ